MPGTFSVLTSYVLHSILGFTKLPVGYSVTPYSAHIVPYQALTHRHYLILIGYSFIVLYIVVQIHQPTQADFSGQTVYSL